jgi:hypothetical protein
MRLMAAALALSLTVAVVAAAFALWPALSDAPWEPERSDATRSSPTIAPADAIALLMQDICPNAGIAV